ncbi:hypothetical protein BDV96DRAFT_145698 [Lophiotrema nucula]|uniref:RING-type E3 ubiquitin transferase n=1 Tax=Lophiotrema nucula TaxID=690887 RepID=A0A6A5Z0E9_9PLEO|nr:hypothetical protein BDV96DRAFT_145698 [Lophiotrema nucula]
MVACRFFLEGRCLKGNACSFDHPSTTQHVTTEPALNAIATNFQPSHHPVTFQPRAPCIFHQKGTCKRGVLCRFRHDGPTVSASVTRDPRSDVTCSFYRKNTCGKGSACPFKHELDVADSLADAGVSLPGLATSTWAKLGSDSTIPSGSSSTRSIGGATVKFEEGAGVANVSLPSDFSAVTISDVPRWVSTDDIIDVLARYGFEHLPKDSISSKPVPKSVFQLVYVKVADPGFAQNLLRRAPRNISVGGSTVTIAPFHLGGESDAGVNRLQLSSVACSWYKPSRSAYLQYTTASDAKSVISSTKRRTLSVMGRELNVSYQPTSSIVLGNLDPTITKAELKRHLPQPLPLNIVWGNVSHLLSAERIEDQVKTALKLHGNLVDWVVTTNKNGSRVKAVAKFSDAEMARVVVKELNGTLVDTSSEDKLRVTPIVSVKLSVPHQIMSAVKSQFDALRDRVWKSGFVTIKAYDNLGKPHTQIRIHGEERSTVAHAKTLLEQLLAGHVARNNDKPISDAFFFRKGSRGILQAIMDRHDVFISRDLRKLVLRLYGESKDVQAAQVELVVKSADLAKQVHVIELDASTWSAAIRGGFRQIVAVVGKDKARMDVVTRPKRIILNGSEQDYATAQEILQQATTKSSEIDFAALSFGEGDELLCPVCWTPPDEPYKTNCGHTYCRSCIASQCTSSGEGDFPIICLGESATCGKLLTLSELHAALSVDDFENMLQTSFNGYVRSRPTIFRNCPTADCDRFYRTSSVERPRVFDCDGCLSSICTACHQTTHDGLTCDEQKALIKAATDGSDEFAKWKEENDVRDCPNCTAPIEKSHGCNHMECRACHIHICWFCMKTFAIGSQTYGHMNTTHGNFY